MSTIEDKAIPDDLLAYYPPQNGLILKAGGTDFETAREAQLTYARACKVQVKELCTILDTFDEEKTSVKEEKCVTEILFDLAADARIKVEAAKKIDDQRLRYSNVKVGV